MSTYVGYVYNIVKQETEGLDSFYEDYIVNLVGIKGLLALQSNKLIETCGVIGDRQLYVLCDKK
jgi:hypothetical protein